MKIVIASLKAELKVLASEIRTLKLKRKELCGFVPGLRCAQEQFRIKHIVYCMLRGTKLEDIEQKLRDPKDGNHHWVRKQAAGKLESILNPKVEQPVVVKETLWNKVISYLF